MSKADYLIRSFEHELPVRGVCWWRPNECGYTNDIGEAGLYTKERADEICARANITDEINEKAVHKDQIIFESPRNLR